MSNFDTTETVATYTKNGRTYEIDHLGIGFPRQYGEFAVYSGGRMVAGFETRAAGHLPEHRPALPDEAELIRLAKQAVKEA